MINADSLLAPGFHGRWLAGEAGEEAAGKRGFVGVAGSNMDDDLDFTFQETHWVLQTGLRRHFIGSKP